jgi:hypothetical protein
MDVSSSLREVTMKYIKPSAALRLGYIEVLKVMCKEVNSPHAHKCLRELNRNFVRFDNLDVAIDTYDDPVKLILDRQVTGAISKCPSIPSLEDPELNCIQTFNKFEKQCELTNIRFASGRHLDDPDVVAVLHTAKRKIANILGDVPDVQDLPFTFGPGSTRNVKRRTSAFHKICAKPECTYEALVPSLRLLASVPSLWTAWGGSETDLPSLKTVPGSHFGQVPKNAKTNRPINIEPTLNSVLQKGYGTIIRNRLGRSNNCIRSGQARHAILSREASIHKKLATIDKSGASDSIASMLVLDLLPINWFEALDSVRSSRHYFNGEWQELQKFSAMGNGFTFELETLIFLALARATAQTLGLPLTEISVYGDDVILPTEAMPLYLKVCEVCGFTINEEKSFWGSSPFRESCGSDWFNGIDVRVAYMRHEPTPHYLTTFHNRLVELGISHLLPLTIKALQVLVPKQFRVFGPISNHKYGYLWDPDVLSKVRAVNIVPRKHRPKGPFTLPYAIYSTQFIAEPEPDIVFDKRPISMERFTTRSDFKLKHKWISACA